MEATYCCAYCFEPITTVVDLGGGANQQYVEDCQVCCRPNVISTFWDEETEQFVLEAWAES